MTANRAIESYLGMTQREATERVMRRLEPYVEIETPSRNAGAIAILSRRIEAELRAAGAAVEALDAPGLGRNLRALVEGVHPNLAPIVALAHIDTVHPVGTLETQPMRRIDGRGEGPGIFDMKAGVALLVEAISILRSRRAGPRRSLRFLVTCDEEIGSHSSRGLIREAAAGAEAALVLEPSLPDGAVKTSRKGVSTYRLEANGRAAHAGVDPERAVSAVAEIAHQILAVLATADPSTGTTVNIGLIHGGTASNVVPARAWATIDVRFVTPAEGERVDAALHRLRPILPAATIDVTLTESRPPLERTAGVVRLYEHARTLAAEFDTSLGEGSTGGASDGSLIATHGLPTLDGLGPRGGGAHAVDEHILLEDLPFRLALVCRLLETL
ncbi:MAG: M20 family metallopeptidase [Longimicrobiales bacterium]